jgi:hypothetical protein
MAAIDGKVLDIGTASVARVVVLLVLAMVSSFGS